MLFQASVTKISEPDMVSENGEIFQSNISGSVKAILQGLILVLGLLYNEKYTHDYHVVLSKVLNHRRYEANSVSCAYKLESRLSALRAELRFSAGTQYHIRLVPRAKEKR